MQLTRNEEIVMILGKPGALRMKSFTARFHDARRIDFKNRHSIFSFAIQNRMVASFCFTASTFFRLHRYSFFYKNDQKSKVCVVLQKDST